MKDDLLPGLDRPAATATLAAVSQALLAMPAATLADLCGAICRNTEWSICGIIRVDRDRGVNRLLARYDPLAGAADVVSWTLATSPVQHVLDTGRPYVLADVDRDPVYHDYRADALRRGYRTVVLAPLILAQDGGAHVCLSLKSYARIEVGPARLELVEALCALAAPWVGQMLALDQARARLADQAACRALGEGLIDAALAAASPEAFCAGAEGALPGPFWLYACATGRLLAAGQGAEGIGEALRAQAGAAAARLQQDPAPARLDLAGHGLDLLALRAGDRLLGFLAVPPGGPAEVTAALARAATVALHREAPAGSERDRLAAAVLRRLVEDGPDSSATAEDLRAIAGIDPRQALSILVLRPAGPAPLALDELAARVRLRLRGLGRPVAAAVAADALWIVAQQAPGLHRQLRRLGDDLLQETRGGLALIAQETGKGAPLSPAVAACRRMLRHAAGHDLRGWLDVGRIGPGTLLLAGMAEAEARAFVQATLGRLAGQGDPRARQMLETLECYLAEEGRLTAAATRLGIHVTTLRYRLERIAAALGADLDDSGVRFDLRLALNLHRMAARPPCG